MFLEKLKGILPWNREFTYEEIPQRFNAIVEGIFLLPENLTYKITNLDVPEERSSISDISDKLKLYGVAKDFERIRVPSIEEMSGQDEEFLPHYLKGSPGRVLENRPKDLLFLLRSPRSIILEDGRIFVNEAICENRIYTDSLPTILEASKYIFSEERYQEFYREAVNTRNRHQEDYMRSMQVLSHFAQ